MDGVARRRGNLKYINDDAGLMREGLRNIRDFMGGHDRIDFVFTHDAPASDKL